MLLVGELDRTAESPALVASLVRESTSSEDDSVAVGLQIPVESPSSINRLLKSAAKTRDRQKLLANDFWDKLGGRASKGMLELLTTVQRLHRHSAHIGVFCFGAGESDAKSRDARMAQAFQRAIASEPHISWIVLSENTHTRLRQSMTPMGEQPMGSYLIGAHPVLLVVSAPQGSAWNCQETCGPHSFDLKVHDSVKLPALIQDETVHDQGYDAKCASKGLQRLRPRGYAPRSGV